MTPSLSLPSVVSCCAEVTTCAWRSRPRWLGLLSWRDLLRSPSARSRWRSRNRMIQAPVSAVVGEKEYLSRAMEEWGATLTALANGADLLITGRIEQGLAANVAEYYGIPQAALHFFPGAHSRLSGWAGDTTEEAEDAQRRALGLPDATGRSTRSLGFKPTTRSAFPSWQPSGRTEMVGGPSSGR